MKGEKAMAGSQYSEMTDKQWNAILETIARRIEEETGDTRAAEIVRESKTNQGKS